MESIFKKFYHYKDTDHDEKVINNKILLDIIVKVNGHFIYKILKTYL